MGENAARTFSKYGTGRDGDEVLPKGSRGSCTPSRVYTRNK